MSGAAIAFLSVCFIAMYGILLYILLNDKRKP